MIIQKFLLTAISCLLLTALVSAQGLIEGSIRGLAEQYVNEKGHRGLVVGVIQEDQADIQGFGQLSANNKMAPDENTIFEIGSVSSVFTTTLMMTQSIDGHFDIGDRIQDYLPSSIDVPSYQFLVCNSMDNSTPGSLYDSDRILSCVPDPFTPDACIAFCDLASHTSGLRNAPRGLQPWNPMKNKRRKKADFSDLSKNQLFEGIAKYNLFAAPGATYHYSNLGIGLLGNVLAEIRQIPFETLLTDEVLKPLDLNDTKLSLSPSQLGRLAPGHNEKGKEVAPWQFDAMGPALGLKSTAADLLRFASANLQEEQTNLSAAFEQAQQARLDVIEPKVERKALMGYSWFSTTLTKSSNRPVIWQNGGTAGYRCFIGFVKSSQTAVVLLSNSAHPVDEIGFEILTHLNSMGVVKPENRSLKTTIGHVQSKKNTY